MKLSHPVTPQKKRKKAKKNDDVKLSHPVRYFYMLGHDVIPGTAPGTRTLAL